MLFPLAIETGIIKHVRKDCPIIDMRLSRIANGKMSDSQEYSVSNRVPRASNQTPCGECLKAITFALLLSSFGSVLHYSRTQNFIHVNLLSVSLPHTPYQPHIVAACRAIDITPRITHPKFTTS